LDGVGGCGGLSTKTFINYLKANSEARGTIKIGETSAKDFRRLANEYRDAIKAGGIARPRVRIIFQRVRRNSLGQFTEMTARAAPER